MAPVHKFPLRTFVLLTALPATVIGAGLWYLSTLVPICTIDERARLTSPDDQFDLVVFSHDCGPETDPNTQAMLIPARDGIPDDAASFLSIGATADLAPRWDGFGNIELTVPINAEIYRQDDAVAGISIVYLQGP